MLEPDHAKSNRDWWTPEDYTGGINRRIYIGVASGAGSEPTAGNAIAIGSIVPLANMFRLQSTHWRSMSSGRANFSCEFFDHYEAVPQTSQQIRRDSGQSLKMDMHPQRSAGLSKRCAVHRHHSILN